MMNTTTVTPEMAATLAVGTPILVNGESKYFAEFQPAGSRSVIWYAAAAKEASNPVGTWDMANMARETVEMPLATKPVTPTLPTRPKRSDFDDTDEGEDEYSAAFGEWMELKKAAEAQQAEVATVNQIEHVNNNNNKQENKVMAILQNTRAYNNAAEYVAAVKHLDPSKDWASVKDWKTLCYLLGITDAEIGGDSARRVLDRTAAKQGETVKKPKSVAQTVEVVAEKVNEVIPVKPASKPAKTPTPAPVKKSETTPVAEPVAEAVTVAENVNNFTNNNQETLTVEPQTVPVQTKVRKPAVAVDDNNEDPALQLARYLRQLRTQVDPAMIEDLINVRVGEAVKPFLELAKNNVRTVQVQINNQPAKKIAGLVHKDFDKILKLVAAKKKNVMLVGPAGSGKTTLAGQIAEALELKAYCQSVCAQTSKSELLGYMDAQGQYVSTSFRQAYENGGLFLLDEIDAGNPNVLIVLNSAIDNGVCSFPDGMVIRNANFRCMAGANTFGTGANVQYVGRNQLDGATLNRFVRVRFEYDEELEMNLAPNKAWCKFIQLTRKELINERVIISPRDTIDGGDIINLGFTPLEALEMRLTDAMPDALKTRVMKHFNTIVDWSK